MRTRPARLERRADRVRRREEPREGRGGAPASPAEKAQAAGSHPAAAAPAKWPGAGRLLPRGGARTGGAGCTWPAGDAGDARGRPGTPGPGVGGLT